MAAPPAAPPAPASRREGLHNRLPFRLDGDDRGTDSGLVGPVVRIETTGVLNQPVPFFRRAGSPRDALKQLRVARAKTHGRTGAERLTEDRGVFRDDRHCGFWRRSALLRAVIRPASRRVR
jgi:hypothetical protein